MLFISWPGQAENHHHCNACYCTEDGNIESFRYESCKDGQRETSIGCIVSQTLTILLAHIVDSAEVRNQLLYLTDCFFHGQRNAVDDVMW